MKISHYLPILLSCVALSLVAFGQKPEPEDFLVSGDTRLTGDNCFRLTEAFDWSAGSVWHKRPIDLRAPFVMELDLMLGCEDAAGADGMVFTFTPTARRQGRRGEGMGFAGLVPSLGIEIDTWENEHLGDPPQDHMALLVNGQVSHYYNLVGPILIPNVEDCRVHRLRVEWAPETNRIRIGLDGSLVIEKSFDIIMDLFAGESAVYWGVTSATGQYNNRHEICFEKLDYLPALEALTFDPLTSRRLLSGEIMPLGEVTYASGKSELEEDSVDELEMLVNLLKKYPNLSIEIFGHTDNTGDAGTNLTLSDERAKEVAEYLVRRGIPPERIHARGFGEQYPLANNSTLDGRLANRRVEIHLFRPIP